MKLIQELKGQLKGKKVLVRVDYNVNFNENGLIQEKDASRIDASFETIKFLIDEGARIVLISHLGDNEQSLRFVHKYLQEYFEIGFLPWTVDFEVMQEIIDQLPEGGMSLLENLRQNMGEEINDEKFSKNLANLADFFINDAFSASHRKHSSIVGVTDILPSFAGFQFQKEYDNLKKFLNSEKPLGVVLGGVKFGTKLELLKKYLDIADYIFVGGALAHVFFKAKGFEIGKSVFDESVSVLDIIDNPKIILPKMVIVKDISGKTKTVSADKVMPDEKIVDVASESIIEWSDHLKNCKAILWNGPLGYVEGDFIDGTDQLATMIGNLTGVFRIIGGGDTNSALYGSPALWSIDFVSLAGGAMLDFLVEGSLPGIEVL